MAHPPVVTRIGMTLIALAAGLGAGAAAADVVAVVSSTNPVTTLAKHQTVDIFLGKTNHFPDGRQAVPIDQVEGSSARNEFYARFADMSPAQVKAHWSKVIFTGRGMPPREAADSVEVRNFVAARPDAIGYIDQAVVDDSVKVLLVK